MKNFKKGDMIRLKSLNEMSYIQQDIIDRENCNILGLSACFMFYSEDERCVVSVSGKSYEIPLWLIVEEESKHSICRPFTLEVYQCINRPDLIERIAYLVGKTAYNFKVIQGQKDIKLYIEK